MPGSRYLALLDANVLFYLYEAKHRYINKAEILDKVADVLVSEFGIVKIWISDKVIKETPPKILNVVTRLLENKIPTEVCPIKDRHFAALIKEHCKIDTGEADSIMQVVKILGCSPSTQQKMRIWKLNPVFISNDKDSLKCNFVRSMTIPWQRIAIAIKESLNLDMLF